jgi:hypothetical protein
MYVSRIFRRMEMKVLAFILTLAMVLSTLAAWAAEEKIQLENRLSVGDRLVSESTEESYTWANFKQIGGPLFEQTGSLETTTTVNIVSVDEDGVFDLRMTSEASGTTKNSDQSKPNFIPATEQPVRELKVAKNGEVILPRIAQYELRHPQNPLLDIDDWLAYIARQKFPPLTRLPDKKVGVGDVWTTETPVRSPDGGKLKITSRARVFAFGEMDGYDCAWIQSEAIMRFKFELSGDFEGYSSITVNGVFIWEGKSYFAHEEGRTIKDRNSWNFVLGIEIPLEEKTAAGFFTTRVISTSATSLSRPIQ